MNKAAFREKYGNSPYRDMFSHIPPNKFGDRIASSMQVESELSIAVIDLIHYGMVLEAVCYPAVFHPSDLDIYPRDMVGEITFRRNGEKYCYGD